MGDQKTPPMYPPSMSLLSTTTSWVSANGAAPPSYSSHQPSPYQGHQGYPMQQRPPPQQPQVSQGFYAYPMQMQPPPGAHPHYAQHAHLPQHLQQPQHLQHAQHPHAALAQYGQPTPQRHSSIAYGGGPQSLSSMQSMGAYNRAPVNVAPIQAAEVKLEISAERLRDRDMLTKSDPCAVVFLEEKRYGAPSGYPGGAPMGAPQAQQHVYVQHDQASAASPDEVSHWREIGRTESIKDNLNPHFAVHVTVPYRFEELQNIRIGVWDIDTKSKELSTHDFLGDIRTTLGDLVSEGVATKPLSYQNAKDSKTIMGGTRDLGTITIIVHENRDGGKLLVKGRFSGKKLAKRDFFSSDPYLIFTQLGARSEKSRSQVYQTEVIARNRNPIWKPVKFKVDLPKGGNNSHIKLELLCNDKDNLSCDDEIGTANCTLQELQNAQSLPLIFSRKKGRRGYTHSGLILVRDLTAVRMPSLIEYLQGGLKIHFNVAIDMTASNGDPREPLSLHFHDQSYGGNQYVKALTAIGTVLQAYAPHDNMFAAYGFGAELPGQSGVASSCFPLDLLHGPRCHGVEGIINAYTHALNTVRLSGPTNFAPLIETVTRSAAARPNNAQEQNYDVLLILTDGVVTDYNRTVEKIIDASYNAPLSIIIIGIGNADFRKMELLDADNQLLTTVDKKRKAARDIVQFVPFRDYMAAPLDRLAAQVLCEMPQNIVDYFISSRSPAIMPGRAPMVPGTHNSGLS